MGKTGLVILLLIIVVIAAAWYMGYLDPVIEEIESLLGI